MSEEKPDQWRIIIEAEGDGPPVYVRFRKMLKHMLRAWGIRVVSMSQEPKTTAAEGEGKP